MEIINTFYVTIHGEWAYFKGQSAIQVAGYGWDDITLGHSVVTGVGEALATVAAVLALIDLSSAGPHRYSTATLWGFKQQVERFGTHTNMWHLTFDC